MSAPSSLFDGPASKTTSTAIIKQDGPWWIGWVEEVPGVNCQEVTQAELIESVRGRCATC